jgi:hypothetical protein
MGPGGGDVDCRRASMRPHEGAVRSEIFLDRALEAIPQIPNLQARYATSPHKTLPDWRFEVREKPRDR